jgi:hypothetical protein
MFKILEYFGRAQAFRGRLGRWPGWARGLMLVAAIPGALLLGLSIAAVLVSLAALLLLTVPLYRLLSGVLDRPDEQNPATGFTERRDGPETVSPVQTAAPGQVNPATGRRHVEVTIIE